MRIGFIYDILLIVLLCLAQVLVLNNIHILGFATPLLYVYMVLLFRRNYPRWGILLLCFATGLIMDTFSNTPGTVSGAMTFLGFIQPDILKPFIPRDSAGDLKPSMRNLGVWSFIYYTVIAVFIYNVVFFSLEAFNFFNWILWLQCIGGSTIITALLIIVIENARRML